MHPEEAASAAEFGAAVKELTSALGEDAVVTDAASLREFGDPYSPAEWADLRPAVVVRPASTEEVQAVVRIPGEHRLTLWTVSIAACQRTGRLRWRSRGYRGSPVLVRANGGKRCSHNE